MDDCQASSLGTEWMVYHSLSHETQVEEKETETESRFVVAGGEGGWRGGDRGNG